MEYELLEEKLVTTEEEFQKHLEDILEKITYGNHWERRGISGGEITSSR